MKRIKMIVAYDGTNYHGWQIQKNGNTIEAELNKALSKLLNEPILVEGASRTDSGVHAMGNVAVFDTNSKIPADKICFALNQRLPDDIRIQHSEEVSADWHPRRQNCVKTYEYQILNQKIEMPLFRLYSYFYYHPLDLDKMRAAAKYLIGEHDFKSFCTIRTQTDDTVRKIYGIDIKKEQSIIKIKITGNGFLYNMVRIIVGTLLKVGGGKYPPEYMEEILDKRSRKAAGPTIPAKGLSLISLEYETQVQPLLQGVNRYWDYLLLQHQVDTDKTAYLIVKRCDEKDWGQLLRRVIHQAMRNGAEIVYLTEWEKNRIQHGDQYGFYTVEALAKEENLIKKISGQIDDHNIFLINQNDQKIMQQNLWFKVKKPGFHWENG